MTEEAVMSMLHEENAERRKVALAHITYYWTHDPALIKESDHTELYSTLFDNIKKIIEDSINEYDCEKEKYEAVHEEYLLTLNLLCRLNSLEKYYTTPFNKEESQRIFAEFLQYLNAKDNSVA